MLPRRHLVIISLSIVLILTRLILLCQFNGPARLHDPNEFFHQTSETRHERLAVLVQGPADMFSKWYERIKTVSEVYQGDGIALLYASFDIPVNDTRCSSSSPVRETHQQHQHDPWVVPCRTLFIPNTTWTEGRNALAHAAYCWEQDETRHQLFAYWIFADDDVQLLCYYNTSLILSSDMECWRSYFDFVEREGPRSHAVTIALGREIPKLMQYRTGFAVTDSYDAILNAYNREYVPFLLPYVTKMSPKASWWLSQNVHYSVMRSCFPLAGLSPLQIRYVNTMHRSYPRGMGPMIVSRLVSDNYDEYYPPMYKPSTMTDLRHFRSFRWFETVQDVSDHVDSQLAQVNHSCHPLIQRFHDWLAHYESCLLVL